MVPNFITQESSLDDIIVFFKESRQTVQSLDSGINLPIINDSLIFRPGFNGVVPYPVQISYCLSG